MTDNILHITLIGHFLLEKLIKAITVYNFELQNKKTKMFVNFKPK